MWCERRCHRRSRQQASTWDVWQCGLLARCAWATLTASTRARVSLCREPMGMSTHGLSRGQVAFPYPSPRDGNACFLPIFEKLILTHILQTEMKSKMSALKKRLQQEPPFPDGSP